MSYKISEDEIKIILSSVLSLGFEETYNQMRAKAFLEGEDRVSLSSDLLDISETFLEMGREEMKQGVNQYLINVYYTIHFLLRKLAQEVSRKFKSEDQRLLRIISINEEAPQILENK